MSKEKKSYIDEELKANSDEKLTDPASEGESYMEKMKAVYLPEEQKDFSPKEERIEKLNGLTSAKSNPIENNIPK